MKRLSSDKAQKILEFLIRKRLRAASAKIMFVKQFKNLYSIEVEILYSDGKGKTSPLLVVDYFTDGGSCSSQAEQIGVSFAKLIRWMEKETKAGSAFEVDGTIVYTDHDSIDAALIDMDLEDKYGN